MSKWLKHLLGKPCSFKEFIVKAKEKNAKTIFLSGSRTFSTDIGGVDNWFNAYSRADTGLKYSWRKYEPSIVGTLASVSIKGVAMLYALLLAWEQYAKSEGIGSVVLQVDNLRNELSEAQKHGWFKNYETECQKWMHEFLQSLDQT